MSTDNMIVQDIPVFGGLEEIGDPISTMQQPCNFNNCAYAHVMTALHMFTVDNDYIALPFARLHIQA